MQRIAAQFGYHMHFCWLLQTSAWSLLICWWWAGLRWWALQKDSARDEGAVRLACGGLHVGVVLARVHEVVIEQRRADHQAVRNEPLRRLRPCNGSIISISTQRRQPRLGNGSPDSHGRSMAERIAASDPAYCDMAGWPRQGAEQHAGRHGAPSKSYFAAGLNRRNWTLPSLFGIVTAL